MIALPSRPELKARPLVTRRTFLTPMDASDAPDLWQAVDSSRAWLEPWLPWVPYQHDAESALRFAEASTGDWDSGRAVRFAIRERGSALLVGVVGLEACVDLHRNCDLGYWLRKEHSGKGLMTEAAHTCLDYGFRAMGLHRVRVAAATDNHASLRVIGRLGFRFEGIARQAEWCAGRWLDHAIFALLEHEWQPPG